MVDSILDIGVLACFVAAICTLSLNSLKRVCGLGASQLSPSDLLQASFKVLCEVLELALELGL